LIDLTANGVRIRADNQESTIALDTIQSLSFGTSDEASPAASVGVSADFAKDASTVLGVFQTTATSLQSGVDYTDFGRQVTELRRAVEKFLSRYSTTENASESRVTSLVAASLTDYNWSRTIWTLKFGRSSDGAAFETDSPALADALAAYPELKAAGGGGNKYSIDRVIAGLWQKASEKVEKARALSGSSR
jgi:hypothetical protein